MQQQKIYNDSNGNIFELFSIAILLRNNHKQKNVNNGVL